MSDSHGLRPPAYTRLNAYMVARLISLNKRIWQVLPEPVRRLGPVHAYATWLHALISDRAEREMYLGTLFLRNRPALELMRKLAERKAPHAELRIAVLGCSIGVEVYSILWALRTSRPDLIVMVEAVDISPDAIEIGRAGAFGPAAVALVQWPIFDALTEHERSAMFDWDGDTGYIKPWLRSGINWRVGDVSDPGLISQLGLHDLVVANNFLCHMRADAARNCLRTLSRLVSPGGHLCVSGVDLDVRAQVTAELGWEPVSELRSEIHDGDPLVRGDWPLRWWGLEPLDQQRHDWERRYASVFQNTALH